MALGLGLPWGLGLDVGRGPGRGPGVGRLHPSIAAICRVCRNLATVGAMSPEPLRTRRPGGSDPALAARQDGAWNIGTCWPGRPPPTCPPIRRPPTGGGADPAAVAAAHPPAWPPGPPWPNGRWTRRWSSRTRSPGPATTAAWTSCAGRAGRGTGPIPWEHEPNRGFLRSLHALGRAAAALGEQDEAERCRTFLADSSPQAAAELDGA